MKRFWVIPVLMLAACQSESAESEPVNADKKDTAKEEKESPVPSYELLTNDGMIPVEELEKLEADVEVNDIHRTIDVTAGENLYRFIEGVPVMEENGLYYPLPANPVEAAESPSFSPAAVEEMLGAELIESEAGYETTAVFSKERSGEEPPDLDSMTVEEMSEHLSFLDYAIEDASVSTIEGHLPGAPREYRNGFHEGIDYYGYASGTGIDTTTEVLGMAEGVVVRADTEFEDYASEEERNEELAVAAEAEETPEYILDRLRGMQVWVQYDNGVMIRFAHLHDIAEGIETGVEITSETVIGYVGNSGTSSALEGESGDLHLHKDLLVYGDFFWEPFSLEETSQILQNVWP
ncbi:M23 family metallopeptidase [Alkalicoccus urumqiensis]|uniref:M23 family peptidase n=1 Tax=Alkalicoccus urumqiensis TaxID=1548213 RepID=A0A2P6MEP7_ALKUR|nr:M23 family metallopeptidase [Alkalicoccus urumqiensis]PRO64769.1 M23 family peptidase [Alkalicoccus urumqiensis]